MTKMARSKGVGNVCIYIAHTRKPQFFTDCGERRAGGSKALHAASRRRLPLYECGRGPHVGRCAHVPMVVDIMLVMASARCLVT